MNRQEAALVIKDRLNDEIWKQENGLEVFPVNMDAFRVAIKALRGPQPQPAQPEAGSPTTQHCPEQASNTRQLIDACDRLRWLLTQAECAGVPVEKEDREAVRMAIDILKKG